MTRKRVPPKTYDVYFWMVVGYTLFLFFLPRLMPLLVPCLSGPLRLSEASTHNVSYTYAQCNTQKALDTSLFIILSTLFVIVSIIFIYVSKYIFIYQKTPAKLLLPAVFSIVLCTILAIGSFYFYLPSVMHNIDRAPIILDTVPK